MRPSRPTKARAIAGVTEPANALAAGPYSVGDALRQRREALRLDLGRVAGELRIKPAYLAALEAGRPDQLPGSTYAIGFLRAYADHLGLDSADVLRRYKEQATALATKPDLSFPMPLGERSIPGSGTLLAGMILAFCGYGIWYYWSTGERARPERVAPVPAELLALSAEQPRTGAAGSHSAEALAAAPSEMAGGISNSAAPIVAAPAAVTPSPSSEAPEAAPHLASAGAPNLHGTGEGSTRIVIRAMADSWVQIRNTGQSVLLARVLKSGDVYRVPDQPGLSMRTGNAGGLEITVDGRPAPPIGGLGMVRRKVALDPDALIAGGAVRE
jgi:cytoskeleton protein RodZ